MKIYLIQDIIKSHNKIYSHVILGPFLKKKQNTTSLNSKLHLTLKFPILISTLTLPLKLDIHPITGTESSTRVINYIAQNIINP